MSTLKIGDRVRVWPRGRGRHPEATGVVVGIDNGPRPGVQIRFDAPVSGAPDCYATHGEVELVHLTRTETAR